MSDMIGPVDNALWVTFAEAAPLVTLADTKLKAAPAVCLTVHVDDWEDGTVEVPTHRILELALTPTTVLQFQKLLADAMVDIFVATCDDPECRVHNHDARSFG